MPRTLTPKQAKAKADRLFSELVRAVGYCEYCGKRPPAVQLQCAHWIGRTYSHVRVDPDNAFCLDAACHRYFTNHPTEFALWALSMKGEAVYQRLLDASRERSKVNWPDQVRVLREMLRGVA